MLPIACSFNDDLVAGIGQPVKSTVAKDGVIEEPQPFLNGSVAGHNKTGLAVASDDEFVKVR